MEILDLTILIPAAGFGRRMGSPMSKEMLPDPANSEKPMIDWTLELAQTLTQKLCIITRTEKTNLIKHLTYTWRPLISMNPLLEIGATSEWPETLLQSEHQWTDWNLVLLPDTRFEPRQAPAQLIEQMIKTESKIGFGVFTPEKNDFKTWGTISTTGDQWIHCEKPKEIPSQAKTQAWGFFAFHSSMGRPLLKQLLESTMDHEWRSLPAKPSIIELTQFKDLTRDLPA